MDNLCARFGKGSWIERSSYLSIRLASRLAAKHEKPKLPEHAATIINLARKMIPYRGGILAKRDEHWCDLEKDLATLIYSSNRIEAAGTNMRITRDLCHDIFYGRPVNADINEQDTSFQEHLEYLSATGRKCDQLGVIQSRNDVMNHAKALSFLITRIAHNTVWSEQLILQTHRILCEGTGSVTPGQHRDYEVAVSYSKPGQKGKSSMCPRAAVVPGYMKEIVQHLNKDIHAAEESGHIDPYSLAARYHHQFSMVHPFGDGNGRMSRMILNVLLLNYTGHVAPFGLEENDKDEYLAIVRKASDIFSQEDIEVNFSAQTCHFEFAEFVLAKSKTSLQKMWTRVTR